MGCSNKFIKLSLGGDGTKLLTGTTLYNDAKEDRFQRLVMNEDTVFDTILDIKGNNLMTRMNITNTDTISKGIVINSPYQEEFKIAEIKLVSGSVIGIM